MIGCGLGLWLCAPLLLFAPAPRPDAATLLYASLEKSAAPAYAAMSVAVTGNAELVEGGVRIRRDTWLRYRAGRWPSRAGSLEVEFRPGWKGGPQGPGAFRVCSVRTSGKDYLNCNVVARGRFGVAIRGSSRGAAAWGRAEFDLAELKQHRWNRLTIAWDTSGLRIYLGRRLMAMTARAAPMLSGPMDLRFGGGEFLIRRLRISDRARDPTRRSRTPVEPRPAAPRGPPLFEPEGVYRIGFRLPPKGPPLRLAVKHYAADLDPRVEPDWQSAQRGISITAARGETEPATFVIYAARDLAGVNVRVAGIPAVVRRVVRAPMRRIYSGKPEDYEIVSRFLPRFAPLDIAAGEFREIWLSVAVPEDAEPGLHAGSILITAGDARAPLPFHLRVLPFSLPPDPAKRMGFYYRGAGRLIEPGRLQAELEDMRAHEVSDLVLDVGPLFSLHGKGIECTGRDLFRLLGFVARAGFHETVVVLDGLDRLARLCDGLEDPRMLPAARKGAGIVRQAQQRFPMLRLVVTHMDEVFGRNRLERYIALAKIARSAGYPPLYVTFNTRDDEADRMRARIDPFVDLRCHHGYTFEWWLAKGHTIAEYKRELAASGDEAWLYHNVRGSFFPALWGRLINGIYLRASPFTLNTPWIYQAYGGSPYDDTDSPRSDFGFAFPEPDGSGLAPTRIYACLREGQDDCRYLHLLETTARKRATAKPEAARAAAALLDEIERKVTLLHPVPGKPGTRGEAPLIDALSRSLDGPGLDRLRSRVVDSILRLRQR